MTAMVVASGVLVALLILLREWLGSLGGSVAGITFLVIVAFFYFVPTIVAAQRDIPNKNSVFIINLFLGWTFIGWVIALAMAMGQAETKKTTVGQLDLSSDPSNTRSERYPTMPVLRRRHQEGGCGL